MLSDLNRPTPITRTDSVATPSVLVSHGTGTLASPTETHALLDAMIRLPESERIRLNADSLRYNQETILLKGHAVIQNRNAQLKADTIRYHRQREWVEATAGDSAGMTVGRPVLQRAGETLGGERIIYDLANKRGAIYAGRIQRRKAFYAGEKITIRSEEEFHVHSGSYTTCNLEHPHFDFYSPRIKVVNEETAIARPVYFRVGGKRILWIPFYIFSLREHRQSGLLTPSFGRRPVRFGAIDKEWEARNLGYYFAPNDYWDLTFSGDFRTRSGWLGRSRLRYALRDRINGHIETRIESRQSGMETAYAWRTTVRHSQTLQNNARFVGDATFQSNKSFNRDNSYNLYDRLDRTLRSNFTYNKRWRESGNSINLTTSRTSNLDNGSFATTLPQISFRKARQPILSITETDHISNTPWYGQIYYDVNANLRNTWRGDATATTTETQSNLRLNVSSQHKPFPWLQISPRFNQNWSDSNLRNRQQPGLRKSLAGATLRLNQTFYGMFFPQIGSVTGVRHVLNPAFSVSYEATRSDTGGILGFGGAKGRLQQNRPITLSLDNSFWVKVERDEEERKIRLAQLRLSATYNTDRQDQSLSDVTSSLAMGYGKLFDTRLTLVSGFYDSEGRFRLIDPHVHRMEISSRLHFTRHQIANEIHDADNGPSPAPELHMAGQGSSRALLQDNAPYGYEGGLQYDVLQRQGTGRLSLSHYFSRNRGTLSSQRKTTTRSWLRLSLGLSRPGLWHVDYSANFNAHSPGTPLYARARVTSELLSVQREFHDWTATFNIEPTRFSRNRTFYFRAQFKDLPQIRFEQGDRR